ncbi:small multidrug efflux protein [Frigoribacterium faeni]|uniref:small multidrug efflux protein n=1 Tax=Frigoribacterium faeni TaxID=145483 RepID=UPI00141A7D56|nr:small multidrug efflux protein [Frigoribacterium faeni]NIJ04823.1 hypothetical protein [Frigoribacterium faeni]
MSRIVLTASSAATDPDGPFAWFRGLVDQVPEAVQPLLIALAAAVPFVEGELGSVLGILGGLHPAVAALAAFTGNLLCVVGVVLLGSRIREALVRRRAARGLQTAGSAESAGAGSADTTAAVSEKKGKARLRRWLVRFGVPGASLLAPLALPTMVTAATFVASGVPRTWVILWQAVAIAVWTTLTTLIATGVLSAVG